MARTAPRRTRSQPSTLVWLTKHPIRYLPIPHFCTIRVLPGILPPRSDRTKVGALVRLFRRGAVRAMNVL